MTNNQSKELEERLKILESDIRKSKIHWAEWVSIIVALVVGGTSLYYTGKSLSITGKSLSISNTALKLSKLEKKPSFSHLIEYDKDKAQYFLYVENKSKNRVTGLLVTLVPKIRHTEKAEMRDGKPIEVPTDTEKIFGKNVYDRYPIDNFYEINKIKDKEEVWMEGNITYKNMETDDWDREAISYIKIKKK